MALFQLTVNSEVFARFMQKFVKMKLSRNGEITLAVVYLP